jgi:hypothetical protein
MYQANCPIVINGIWTARGNVELEINYISCQNVRYTGKLPFRLFYFYDINPNFTCICIDNPNVNPYILINPNSIADTYPQETDVKEGVIYGASMEKEGILTLPIESLVMKGVEYGGDKTGTLEVIALTGATATADSIAVVNLTEQQVNRVSQCATKETVDEAFEEFISESATIIDKASVITGDATVIKGDVAAVNLTREQIERIKNCATVSTVQRCFSDFKNKK